MIHIGFWDVPIPACLSTLPNALAWTLITIGLWLAIAVLVQVVVLRLLKVVVRRSGREIEDVVYDVTRRPLLTAIILLGLADSLAILEAQLPWVESLRRWMVAGVMAVAAYWLWRMIKEVVVHYGERVAQRSETRLDDVLLPIVNPFAPIAIILVGGSAILQYLGVRLDALQVAIGGAAFILAFALQDILSNVFSGLSLLVDTPFRYGDLVKLEDRTVCQVVKIGVRVTQLFDIDAHAVIYMPNSKLANERLMNLMQPTPELISSVDLLIGREHDVERVRQVLNDVLDGPPDLLGDIPVKLTRLQAFEVITPASGPTASPACRRSWRSINAWWSWSGACERWLSGFRIWRKTASRRPSGRRCGKRSPLCRLVWAKCSESASGWTPIGEVWRHSSSWCWPRWSRTRSPP